MYLFAADRGFSNLRHRFCRKYLMLCPAADLMIGFKRERKKGRKKNGFI